MTKTYNELSPLRKLAWNCIPTPIISICKTLFQGRSFLYEQRYLRSLFTHKPIGMDGKPVPWFSYSAIDFLNDRLKKKHKVFEYGSGNSTLYFQRTTGQVISVEHHDGWYKQVSSQLNNKENKVILEQDVKSGAYAKSINTTNLMYDIIIIDGIDRVRCVTEAIKCLAKSGVVILDDATREEYLPAIELLKDSGYKQLRFYGLRPASPYFDATDIYYKSANCLDI